MAINPAAAAKAYASTAGLTSGKDTAAPLANPEQFSSMVNSAIQNVADTGTKAEAVTSQLASGKADVVDLVTAVAETEVAVQTLVTVRDRVVTAYQEILNMPI